MVAPLLVPVTTLPNAMLPGLTATGGTPVPLSGTFCGLPVALLVTVTAALKVPAAAGAKATKIVQLEPAVRFVEQFVLSGKLVLLAPVTAMLEKVIVLDPVLVTVIDLFPLLVPKACLPKPIDAGDRVSVGDPALPQPGTLKVEIRVFQIVDVPVSLAARYSATYQKAQPPTGSTVIAL